MHLAQAETLCPTARFLPSREEAYRIAHQALVAAAGRFTPMVETAGLGFVYAQVSGLERIAGSDTELARRLSIDTYSTSGLLAEMCRRLAKLGINTLGAFAALPRTAIVHQFGPYAGPLYDLACGVDPRPVQPEAPPLVVERRRVFDDPLFDVQPLLAHAHQMAAELGEELSHQGYQAEGVRLQLKAGSKVYAAGVPVKPPSADPEKLGRLAGRLLDQWLSAEPDRTLSSPLTNSQIEVDALTLSSYPLRPAYLAITQPGLFARGQQSHEQLREVLRGLRTRFGELVIVKASLIGPPPPRPVEVTTGPDGLPRALVWRDQIHRVAAVYESWRERRCWWGRPVERDYFRLEISNLARPTDDAGGRQVRVVFRDLRADQWLLEQRRI
jgi:nucleotidyltransferase/DNA polymerase involved in DNA repair